MMAKYDAVYNKVIIEEEGGYSNVSGDAGGETYRGVTAKYYPDWVGWEIVRKQARKYGEIIPEADILVKRFYVIEYWIKLECEEMPDSIAERIFRLAVHTGAKFAIKSLQRSLNLLNKQEKLYHDVDVDGIIGTNTMVALLMYCDYAPVNRLEACLDGFAFVKIMESTEKREVNEKFFHGWIERYLI